MFYGQVFGPLNSCGKSLAAKIFWGSNLVHWSFIKVYLMKASFWKLFRNNFGELNFSRTKISGLNIRIVLDFYLGLGVLDFLSLEIWVLQLLKI